MPQFMLISMYSTEGAGDFEITPEMIQAVLEKYAAWNEKMQRSGRLVAVNKLTDTGGKRVNGFGDRQVVTDGPFTETKEVVGGYWIVEAADYDEAVEMSRDCPSLEFGGFLEIREIEDFSKLGA